MSLLTHRQLATSSLFLAAVMAGATPAWALVCGDANNSSSALACEGLPPGAPCGPLPGQTCIVVDVEASFWPWGEDSIACGCAYSKSGLSADDDVPIADDELRTLLDTYVPTENAESTVVVLTQCFGGDMLDDFDDRDDTTVLSATSPGETAFYGGYDDDATGATDAGPDRTTDDIHQAGTNGKHPDETPTSQGPGASLEPTDPKGPITSRHILIYAGKPDPRDNAYRDQVKGNFQGDTNTTVVTVGGDGTNGWDYPGTKAGLENALRDKIKPLMKPTEQFILFVMDHGTYLTPGATPKCDLDEGWWKCERVLGLPENVYAAMMSDGDNQAQICVSTQACNFPLVLETRQGTFELHPDAPAVSGPGADPYADQTVCVDVDEAAIDPAGEIVVVSMPEWAVGREPAMWLSSGAIAKGEPDDEPGAGGGGGAGGEDLGKGGAPALGDEAEAPALEGDDEGGCQFSGGTSSSYGWLLGLGLAVLGWARRRKLTARR